MRVQEEEEASLPCFPGRAGTCHILEPAGVVALVEAWSPLVGSGVGHGARMGPPHCRIPSGGGGRVGVLLPRPRHGGRFRTGDDACDGFEVGGGPVQDRDQGLGCAKSDLLRVTSSSSLPR